MIGHIQRWRGVQKLWGIQKKKEIKRNNTYKLKKNKQISKRNREATRKWTEKEIAATESNLNDQTFPQKETKSPALRKQSLGKALKYVNNVLPGSLPKRKM